MLMQESQKEKFMAHFEVLKATLIPQLKHLTEEYFDKYSLAFCDNLYGIYDDNDDRCLTISFEQLYDEFAECNIVGICIEICKRIKANIPQRIIDEMITDIRKLFNSECKYEVYKDKDDVGVCVKNILKVHDIYSMKRN